MKSIIDKQGIELEFILWEEGSSTTRTLFSYATEYLKKHIYTGIKPDDGKPEFASEAHANLGDLCDHVTKVMGDIATACDKKKWVLCAKGCHPETYNCASAHVHTSMHKTTDKKNKVYLMRQKLFNAQPLIAAISQNSPIWNSRRDAYKDVRLAHSTWSHFTNADDKTGSHYLALAKGLGGTTLECRLPSCSFLHQVIGVTAIIRTILEMPCSLPLEHTQQTFKRVLKWGMLALVPIFTLDDKLSFYGIKSKQVEVPLFHLFKAFLNNGESSDILNNVLGELPAVVRSGTEELFNIFTSGFSVSDYFLSHWFECKENKDKFYVGLDKLSKGSYLKGMQLTEVFKKPTAEISLPKDIQLKLDIEELLAEIKRIKGETSDIVTNFSIREKFEDLLYKPSGILSVKQNLKSLLDFVSVTNLDRVGASNMVDNFPTDMAHECIKYRVIKLNEQGVYVVGDDLPYLLQILQSEGYIQ